MSNLPDGDLICISKYSHLDLNWKIIDVTVFCLEILNE
ncbi:hypothetical protein [Salmonella phage Tennessee]